MTFEISICKGVSDLDTSMDYFALPGKKKIRIFVFLPKQPSRQN